MTRKPRLKVQKDKRGKRVIRYFLIIASLFLAGYGMEKQYDVSSTVEALYTRLQNSFTEKTPSRGTIYDRNLKQIATTKERVAVYARTREIESIEKTASGLGAVFGLDPQTLQERLESGTPRLWIKGDISQEEEEKIRNLDLPGVMFQREEKRYYPNGSYGAHLIGYVKDGIGLSGVEAYYDRLLASRKLKQQEEGAPLSHAQDVVLTLNLKIQAILEDLVAEIKKNESVLKVAAYVMESRTGEIVGGAQLPGFDPNVFTRFSRDVLGNIFLEPMYLPAKFRKFLEESANLQALAETGISPPSWSVTELTEDFGGQLRLWERLGLSEAARIDFQAPSQYINVTPDDQKPASFLQDSFGLVPEYSTPLSLLAAFTKLLNAGETNPPFIVNKILDTETGAEVVVSGDVTSVQAQIEKNKASIAEIRRLYRSQTENGPMSSTFFRDEIVMSVGGVGHNRYVKNELTYITIPAGDGELAMMVFAQSNPPGVAPRESSHGNGKDIVGEKLRRIANLHMVSKTTADVVEPEPAGNDNYQGKEQIPIELLSTEMTENSQQAVPQTMPDLRGLSLRKSLRLLKGIEMKIHIEGTGWVVAQHPSPGKNLENVAECTLILEKTENLYPDNVSKGLEENE
jgi:cell division protein FtsI/penicillin-binding protein 2